jgi:polyisoprenoid-binding protein YceI
MRTLVAGIGVAFLIAWTGLGVAAWLLVGERLHVTFANDGGSNTPTPDPSALLAEQVGVVQADVHALATTLEQNLEILEQDLERRDDERRRADAGAIGELRSAIGELRSAIGELQRGVETNPVEPVQASEPLPEEPVAVEPRSETTWAAPAATPGAAAPPQKRSFLAFALPSAALRFDARQRFEIIPSLSRVGFDAKSTLHDFTGVTSEVSGAFTASLAHPEREPTGRIAARAAALDTGLTDRNAEMYRDLATEEHGEIGFEIDGFRVSALDVAAESLSGTVSGRMTIRGTTRALDMPVQMHVDESKRLVIEGSTSLRLTDYRVPVPSKLGLISMQDEVRVWLALRARAAGEAKN